MDTGEEDCHQGRERGDRAVDYLQIREAVVPQRDQHLPRTARITTTQGQALVLREVDSAGGTMGLGALATAL